MKVLHEQKKFTLNSRIIAHKEEGIWLGFPS